MTKPTDTKEVIMSEITTTIYKCDRCGAESYKKDFNDGDNEGSLHVTYTGSRGMKSYDGAWGGANINEHKKLLCFKCLDKFREFMSGIELATHEKQA